jgi:competence protein ComEC
MSKTIVAIIGLVIVANIFVWGDVARGGAVSDPDFYFLDVGQGDSEVIQMSHRVTYMIDGGKNDMAANALSSILPFLRRRIDVLFVSHPQQDHLGGLFDVVRRYDIGVVVWNGERNALWDSFVQVLNDRHIPAVAVAQGDQVRYGDATMRVLWPVAGSESSDENEHCLVTLFSDRGTSALYTADMTDRVERAIASMVTTTVDILKVAHHGSKYASSAMFLDKAHPLVAVIEVGKNSYGHPTQEALTRLADIGARIFRTDQSGTVRIIKDGDGLRVWGTR